MNDVVYQLACFQLTRRPTRWRCSHARHHTDTLVTGRDPEFNVTLPPNIPTLLLNLFALKNVPKEVWTALRHAAGHISADEKTYIPEMALPSAVRTSRIWVLVWALVIGAALATQSWLPLLLLGPLPSMAGAWLMHTLGLTQHAGLPENVLDHRLNSRTILMGPVLRFLYWNMNYHVEHHMFPLVPYHALPKLHALMKADCPPPYTSTVVKIYQAFGQGDIPTILAHMADDVQWEAWADNSAQKAGVPWLQARQGKDGVLAFFRF